MFIAALLFAVNLYGPLQPGPHAVGFQVVERYDYSRPYLSAGRKGERARPMQISIWYPAEANSGTPMRFGDYVALVATATNFGNRDTMAGDDAVFNLPGVSGAAQRSEWKAAKTWARRDAKPAAGKFPLIVWSLHWPALSHATPEYLASHGYVVITMPRVDSTPGAGDRAATDLWTKALDNQFLINEAARLPAADVHNIGLTGFSAGGHWALGEAMRNPDVRAVVSLDSIMLYHEAVGQAFAAMPFYSLDRVRVPVLHMIRSVWVPNEDASLWTGMRYADRTCYEFTDPTLDHFDFQSVGYEATLLGARPEAAAASAKAFSIFNRATLAFFDAHLKGGPPFDPSSPDPRFVKATHLAALPAKPTTTQFLETMTLDGVDAALSFYRQVAPLPELTLNTAGYVMLLAQRRPADAAKLFALNVEAYPTSANARDSYGDALEALGDKARAIVESQKALELLDADDTLSADRKAAVRKNVEDKMNRLRR
ncbi:MAG TPA: hypothetical protein VGR02_02655 [Thermoanaerobaculia bacterium]|jgi:dienelactone hydrolase|nr:hypothetical protein [Thermoanaerobaculia bacterium]